MNQDDQEAYTHFKETLDAELRQNVKTVIMSLTMLAEDYKASGAMIVRAVEEYIKEVTPETKILGLYLMDSITKNLKSNTNYVELFQKNLINIFTHVFSNVNEQNRAALYKLRQTWNSYFSNSTLFSIDVTINKIDPAWPITAVVASSVPQTTLTTTPAPVNRNPPSQANNSVPRPLPVPVTSKPPPQAKPAQQEPKDKPVAKQPSPVKVTTTTATSDDSSRLKPSVSSLAIKMATSQIQSQSDPRLARDPRLVNKPKAPAAESSESQQQTTPKKQLTTSPSRPPQVKPPLMNGMKRSSPGSANSEGANPVETKKPKFSNTTNQTNETPATNATSARPSGSQAKSQAQPAPAPQQQQSAASQLLNKLKHGNNENSMAKPAAAAEAAKPVTTTTSSSSQPRPAVNAAAKLKDAAGGAKPAEPSSSKENAAAIAKPAAGKTIPSLLDVQVAQPASLDKSAAAAKFKIGKLSDKTTTTAVGVNGVVAKKPVNQKASAEADNPFQNDKDLRHEVPAAPSIVENILRQITSLSTLVSSPRDSSDSPPPPAPESTTSNAESTLAENSDKLSQLQAKLNDSKENDKNTNNSKSSTLTLELTNAIRSLLEQQKKLLGQTSTAPEPVAVVKPIIDPKITQLIQQQQQLTSQVDPAPAPAPVSASTSLQDQVTYDLPPIRPRDLNENQNDSLLFIDGRPYKIQPDVRKLVKIYYHDHELFCDTRTKDVYIDTKRVYKMGDPTKEVTLNGRRVRLMYMGKRIECWINGVLFTFRADSQPKQISLTSAQTGQLKRYYVTVDSRTMDMLFNNHRVCTVTTGAAATCTVQLSPDDYERHEISFVCPPKRIMIDGLLRTMRYDLPVPCIQLDGGIYYVIRFSGPPKEIFIDNTPYRVPFDKAVKIKLHGRAHELAWGGPGFEVILDGRPYELQFNKPAREITIGTRNHFVYIGGEAPDVKICGRLPYELYNANERPAVSSVKSSTSVQNQQQPVASAKPPPALDVYQLLENLVSNNLLPPTTQPQPPQQQQPENSRNSRGGRQHPSRQQKEIARIPDLTSFDLSVLRQKHSGAIESLYSGVQCATCGNRFNQHDAGGSSSASGGQSRYAKHLDWHFRQNKREKEEINKAHSRSWYYSFSEWIQNEEISEEQQMEADSPRNSAANDDASASTAASAGAGAAGKKRKKQSGQESDDDDDDDLINAVGSSLSNGGGGGGGGESTADLNASALNSFTSNGVKICAATNDIGDSCDICKDPFEIFWHNEKEEWYFKDAMRVGDRVYHPICYEDRDESMISSVPATPTPSTPATSSILNPLTMLMNQQLSQRLPESVKNEPVDEDDPHLHQHQHHHETAARTPLLNAHMHDVQMKEVA